MGENVPAKRHEADLHEDVGDVMSVEQAAQFLRVSPLAVYEAAHDGDLPAVWDGAEPLIDRRRLLRQLDPELDDGAASSGDDA